MSEPAAKIDTAAAAKAKPAKVEPLPQKHFLSVGRLQDFEFVHRTKVARVPSGTPAAAVLAFDYLKHYLVGIDDGDLVIFEWEDGTRETWARVLYKSSAGLKLSALLEAEHEAVTVVADDAFKIEHRGHGRKWCVIRADDNLVLKDGLPSQGEATAFLASYLKNLR